MIKTCVRNKTDSQSRVAEMLDNSRQAVSCYVEFSMVSSSTVFKVKL